MAEDHARRAVESRHSADDGLVVAVTAIAVQLVEIGEHAGDIVERVRALGMPCHLRDLPRGQFRVDLLGQQLTLLGQAVDLVGNVDRRILVHIAQLVDLGLQVGDRLLEVEESVLQRQGALEKSRRGS